MEQAASQMLGLIALIGVLTFVLLLVVAIVRPEQLPRIIEAIERIVRLFTRRSEKTNGNDNHKPPPSK